MKKALFLIILFLIPGVLAQKNTIKLLAVNEGTKQGAIVDLDLTVTDGSGKVFIETYPLTQIDTQISLRIAKINACKMSGKYCLDKDFMYSLKTESPVVAGPSAGAAMTLLTMASLSDKKINPEFIITGTINSGGVIGVVGSLNEKIKAAANKSMKKVLIPKGELNSTELKRIRGEFNIDIVEVSNIEEAFEIFTNEKITRPELAVNRDYENTMKLMNEDMCKRTESLADELKKIDIPEKYNKTFSSGLNLSEKAKKFYADGKYYSSASRCFGANVYLREILFRILNLTEKETEKQKQMIEKEIKDIELRLNATEIANLGDLEANMIVKERIDDARKNLNENSTKGLSYALERSYGASSWLNFVGFPGKPIDESRMKESCTMKISEVNEMYNYVAIYVPFLMEETKKELDLAKKYLDTKDYILCLFKASKSEAEINAALSTLYIQDSNVKFLLQNKIFAAKKEIEKQIAKGNFPILGYSYYEYANALNETDRYNALLYAEYGIELSNLDIYFPVKKPLFKFDKRALITLMLGIAIGISLFLIRKGYKRKRIFLKRK